MKTLEHLKNYSGHQVQDHLDMSADIPLHRGLVAQGDIMIIPEEMWARNGLQASTKMPAQPIPASGIVILAGNHNHVLVAEPSAATWTTGVVDSKNLALGTIDVTTEAYILHEEHGATGLAAGRYIVRASREQATIIRRVAD